MPHILCPTIIILILKDLPQEKKGRDEGRNKVIITYILKFSTCKAQKYQVKNVTRTSMSQPA